MGDPDTAAAFDGVNDSARAGVNLSASSRTTVEFWLKWDAFADNDDLALEFTSNFNQVDGGFLVDPNAPEAGGRFAVAIGRGLSRNNAYFQRPSAGQWHHYAFVLDALAPASEQVRPFVDGQPVPFVKTASGTGAGAFADSTLYFMSRAQTALFGAGTLDELAVYSSRPPPQTIAQHHSLGLNQQPSAAFTSTPEPAQTGETVSFNGSGSSDPDGSVVRYEWDLDGNGSFETDSGSSPTTSRSYSTPGPVDTRLRVTDDDGGTDTATRTIHVGTTPPTASFTGAPNPAQTGETVSFNGSGSSDPDGSVARYEWDLDGNGSFETDTGSSPTTSRGYATTGTVVVGLRVTDDRGATGTTTRSLTVEGSPGTGYAESVLGTSGLLSYWRMGELTGTTLNDSKGQNHASLSGPALGAPGAIAGDPDTAAAFDGVNDSARAGVNLSASSRTTVEFWLKWDAFADNDDLALEFTSNFNQVDGGFLVDPNAPEAGGRFAVAIGRGCRATTRISSGRARVSGITMRSCWMRWRRRRSRCARLWMVSRCRS